jgi:hypothetical protein
VKANVIVFEAITFIMFIAFYIGGRKAFGKSRNRAFLVGAILFSLAIETLTVLIGGKNYYWYSINSYYKHYPLGGYIIWLGLVPLAATLLWAMVAATSYLTAFTLMPRAKLWARSALAGGVAVVFQALIEPVAVTNHWWTWNLKSFYFLDVPLVALFGGFGAMFLFTYAFQTTLVNISDPGWLKKVEDATVRRWPVKSNKIAKNLNWTEQLEIFTFRLIVAFAIFAAYMAPFIAIFWAVANRGQIKSTW